MRTLFFILSTITLIGCIQAKPYQWQSKHGSAHQDPSADLDNCRRFAAAQYHPGIPKGEPYLAKEDIEATTTEEHTYGEWRPDRSPFPVIDRNNSPAHDVDIDYTGYPGELDYSPGYTDSVLEKCMLDKGWVYEEVTNEHQEKSP